MGFIPVGDLSLMHESNALWKMSGDVKELCFVECGLTSHI